ncbi:MAG TPA: MerR family transcriptional regulator [Syntrophorhabdaceae bacterium]|jgi:DNA-binding transcriptional MerR regulator
MAGKGTGADERKKRPEEGLRMKELTTATGLPKSAILHYVAQGLLPEPIKTSRNMAYYAPECVERIAFIKSLQERYSFPLNKIRGILASKDEGKDPARIIELCEVIFQGHEGPVFDKKAFCEATGLDPRQVKALRDAKLLLPLDDESFNGQDVVIGAHYARGLALGLHVADLSFYAEAAKRIVDKEMALRKKLTARLPEDQDAGLTAQLVQAARQIRTYVLDRSFQTYVSTMKDFKGEEDA